MTTYTITIGGSRRLPITVHAESDRDVDGVIYDGLESAGFAQCDDCDEWYLEDKLHTLKTVERADTRHCDECYAEAVAQHPHGCRCRDCRDIRESIQEVI